MNGTPASLPANWELSTGSFFTPEYFIGPGAELSGASLFLAELAGADLQGADLTNASLLDADLTNANLYTATMTGADDSGVTWNNTTCPDGSNSNTNGTSPASCGDGHGAP